MISHLREKKKKCPFDFFCIRHLFDPSAANLQPQFTPPCVFFIHHILYVQLSFASSSPPIFSFLVVVILCALP